MNAIAAIEELIVRRSIVRPILEVLEIEPK
jgi:hypothetical protein